MVEILYLLVAAVVAVLVFSRLGLGSVLGYLAAGAIIGPFGLALITDAENLRHIGEFGVVFLLFMIGIEMKPQRLWIMRNAVFGLGGSQVLITGLVLTALTYFIAGLTIEMSLVIGFGLALSSTAFGIQLLSERNELNSQYGRNSFAILLFQDLAVVPLMVLLPLLAAPQSGLSSSFGIAFVQGVGMLLAVLLIGRYAIGPIMHAIARLGNSDAFVALTLLLVLGISWMMELVGLSLAMGAFIAGVMLADSEYRHQVEADILPFRGLLLGVFFMSVGMSLNPSTIIDHLLIVTGVTVGLLAIKTLLIIVIARIWRLSTPTALRSGFLLSQSGEFGFVLFSLAISHQLLTPEIANVLVAIIVLTMIATPLMLFFGHQLAERFEGKETLDQVPVLDESLKPVLIAGFGRVGQTVANMLIAADVPYLAIDADADCVAHARRQGYRVYYGSAARPEVLRSVGAENARLLVVTLDDAKAAEGLVRTARRMCPDVPVHVRARDWDIVDLFVELGVSHAMPETVESSLRLGAAALEAAGVDPERRRELFDELSAENFAKMRSFNKPQE